MIKYTHRKELDIIKYNACVVNSFQSKIHAFSWYLDIVADNWSVLVLDDYKAVMPICWRKKYGVKYVYPPFWLLELGVFSSDDTVNCSLFFDVVFQEFNYVETKLSIDNYSQKKSPFFIEKHVQVLSIEEEYNTIFLEYRKDRRKDVQKAIKSDLTEKWNDKPSKLIQLFKNNVGKRTPFIKEEDYLKLEKLISVCLQKKVGELLSIYNNENKLVASGFFLKYRDCITILVSSTDFKNRKSGENTYLIDRAIFKYQNNYNLFNFGGSSMNSIANYFLSFGAITLKYHQIKYNKLPFLLRLFKK